MKNEVVVSFTTDGSFSKTGFQVDYRTIGKYYMTLNYLYTYIYIYIFFLGCNHNYTSLQGRILNEGVANNCTIKISVPENYTISIYFVQLLMTDHNDCKQNGLEVKNCLMS